MKELIILILETTAIITGIATFLFLILFIWNYNEEAYIQLSMTSAIIAILSFGTYMAIEY